MLESVLSLLSLARLGQSFFIPGMNGHPNLLGDVGLDVQNVAIAVGALASASARLRLGSIVVEAKEVSHLHVRGVVADLGLSE